jgi:hypothetical protein
MEFEKRITFRPAWDCPMGACASEGCDGKPKDHPGNHGRHGVEAKWVLIGSKGAVQFLLYTQWMLPESPEPKSPLVRKPMPADLGYHAYEPQYEGQYRMDSCDLLDIEGGCYYAGSSLNAEPVFERLLREGGDAVWDGLEFYYRAVFGERVGHDAG